MGSGESANFVAHLRAGDWQAFRDLLHTYSASLRRVAYRMTGSSDTADDIVQDVFAVLWQSRETLHVTSSLHAYLVRATRNRALNLLAHDATIRRTAERHQARPEALAMGAREALPSATLEHGELQDRMQQALRTLPTRQQEVMFLRWSEELTVQEIASALGISERVVRKQLAAAAVKLRPVFEDFRPRGSGLAE